MNIFKHSFNKLKRDAKFLLFFELLFIISIIGFLIISFQIMNGFIEDLNVINSQVQLLGGSQDIPVGEVDVITTQLKSLVNKFNFYFFGILPLGLFLIYLVFQTLIYSRITSLKINKRLFYKFTVISLPISILSYIFYTQILKFIGVIIFQSGNLNLELLGGILLGLLILIFILGYFTLIGSLNLRYPIKRIAKISLKLGVSKVYPLVLYYLLFGAITILYLLILFNLLGAALIAGFQNLIINLILILIVASILIYIKILMKEKLIQYLSS